MIELIFLEINCRIKNRFEKFNIKMRIILNKFIYFFFKRLDKHLHYLLFVVCG